MAKGNALNIVEDGLQAFDGVTTFEGRTLVAGVGIAISNADGVSGNPTITSTGSSGLYDDANSFMSIYDDFLTNDVTSKLGWNSSSSSVTSVSDAGVTNGHPGTVVLSTLASSSGFAYVNLGFLSFGSGAVDVSFTINIPILSVAAQRFAIRLGIGNNFNSDPSEGVWFEYKDDVNSGKWQVNTATGGSANNLDSGITADTNWHTFKISINAAASAVSFYIDGVQTSNSPTATFIPTGSISPFLSIDKDAGSTARTVIMDLFSMNMTLTTPR